MSRRATISKGIVLAIPIVVPFAAPKGSPVATVAVFVDVAFAPGIVNRRK